MAVIEPDVRMEAAVHQDVVVGLAAIALAEFESAAEHQVVVDLVVRGAVIEVDVPAVIATPAAVVQDDGSRHIEKGRSDPS